MLVVQFYERLLLRFFPISSPWFRTPSDSLSQFLFLCLFLSLLLPLSFFVSGCLYISVSLSVPLSVCLSLFAFISLSLGRRREKNFWCKKKERRRNERSSKLSRKAKKFQKFVIFQGVVRKIYLWNIMNSFRSTKLLQRKFFISALPTQMKVWSLQIRLQLVETSLLRAILICTGRAEIQNYVSKKILLARENSNVNVNDDCSQI